MMTIISESGIQGICAHRKSEGRKRVEKELTLAMAGSMFNNGVRDNLVKNPIITTKWNPDGVLDDSEIRMIKERSALHRTAPVVKT